MPARGDNLTTMLFVAALFHGVLILGITFGDGSLLRPAETVQSMEVVLLTRDYEKRPDVSDAEYLARQNLVGSGNTSADEGLRVAYGRNSPDALPGPERDGADARVQEPAERAAAEERLYARREGAPDIAAERRRQPELNVRTGMPGTANSVEILALPDTDTAIRGARPRELVISANTRESRIAAYLENWKRRVERVGTLNYPRSALARGGDRNPVIAVSINSDGSLAEALIVTGSGNRELDMAAVDILRLAAPFEAFPDYLRTDYDALKFSYEWRFLGGSVGRMRVEGGNP